jgi:hypothetical protein
MVDPKAVHWVDHSGYPSVPSTVDPWVEKSERH